MLREAIIGLGVLSAALACGPLAAQAGTRAATAAASAPLAVAKLRHAGRLADSTHNSDGTERARGGPPRFAGGMGAQGITHRGYQYVIYYTGKDRSLPREQQEGDVIVARRKVDGGRWEQARITGYKLRSDDAHNRQTIGISGDGAIHVLFDHHAIPAINYARTAPGVADDPAGTPWNDRTFTFTPGFGRPVPQGVRLTYPALSTFPGGDLLLYFRSGGAGNGDMQIVRYDAKRHDWSPIYRLSTPEGNYLGQPGTRNPYLAGGMMIGADDSLHVAWLFRERRCAAGEGANCNHDLYYAFSRDQGRNWNRADGSPIGDVSKGALISIDNVGPPVVAIPIEKRPSNVSIASALDPVTGLAHVLIKHREVPGKERTTASFHYVAGPNGKWTGAKSTFDAADAELAFRGDHLFAFAGRTAAAVYYASRADGFRTWTPVALGKAGAAAKGGYSSWDLSRLDQGVASLIWQHPPASGRAGDPSPIDVMDFQLFE